MLDFPKNRPSELRFDRIFGILTPLATVTTHFLLVLMKFELWVWVEIDYCLREWIDRDYMHVLRRFWRFSGDRRLAGAPASQGGGGAHMGVGWSGHGGGRTGLNWPDLATVWPKPGRFSPTG